MIRSSVPDPAPDFNLHFIEAMNAYSSFAKLGGSMSKIRGRSDPKSRAETLLKPFVANTGRALDPKSRVEELLRPIVATDGERLAIEDEALRRILSEPKFIFCHNPQRFDAWISSVVQQVMDDRSASVEPHRQKLFRTWAGWRKNTPAFSPDPSILHNALRPWVASAGLDRAFEEIADALRYTNPGGVANVNSLVTWLQKTAHEKALETLRHPEAADVANLYAAWDEHCRRYPLSVTADLVRRAIQPWIWQSLPSEDKEDLISEVVQSLTLYFYRVDPDQFPRFVGALRTTVEHLCGVRKGKNNENKEQAILAPLRYQTRGVAEKLFETEVAAAEKMMAVAVAWLALPADRRGELPPALNAAVRRLCQESPYGSCVDGEQHQSLACQYLRDVSPDAFRKFHEAREKDLARNHSARGKVRAGS